MKLERVARTLAATLLALGAVAAPAVGWAATEPAAGMKAAGPKQAANAGTKAQECAKMKKKNADYEVAAAAAPKEAKIPGGESIKSDIAWYKSNCS